MPKITLETKPERFVVGTVQSYTMATRNTIPAQWQAFFQQGAEISGALQGAMFGVSFDADGQGAFRYCVGVEVTQPPANLPEGMCVVALSAGDYAVLQAFGPVSLLPGHFDMLYSEGIAGLGCTPRNGAAFELYPEDARNGPDGMAYEIWAPVTTGAA